ncbi:SIS domain-containing protein [bacterium]|nr:SIS domain-containing protein [bacterium]
MTALDDPASLDADRSGMFGHIRALGHEIVRAWRNNESLSLPALPPSLDSVVVAGMGGSATAGDYFATLCSATAPIPVVVVRGGALPAFASDRTLVVVSSYSGETSESLACYDEARAQGAPVIAITAGGTLKARAAADGVPVVAIDYVSPPRAAIAHTIAPLLRLGAMLELCPADDIAVDDAANECESFICGKLAPAISSAENPAKLTAQALWRRVPLVLGGEHLAPVTTRFKNQLAENGKTLAIAETLPEAAHNIVVGLQTADDDASRIGVVGDGRDAGVIRTTRGTSPEHAGAWDFKACTNAHRDRPWRLCLVLPGAASWHRPHANPRNRTHAGSLRRSVSGTNLNAPDRRATPL